MLFRTILAHVASILALIITLLFASDVEKLFEKPVNLIVVVLALGAALGLAIWDTVKVAAGQPERFAGKNRDAKIRKYMIELFAGDGRCVVSSNDLSWVDESALNALISKAKKGSLELIMPTETDLSIELVGAGAEAHYYSDSSFKFRSRFTLVNVDRADSWVAIGMGTKKAHIIRVISSNEDPVFHMATDLVELAERAAQVRAS